MLDINHFTRCMKMLCDGYDKDFNEQQAKVYYAVLKDYNDKQMTFMTKKVLEEDTFFPKISNLLDKLKQLDVTIESKADEFVGHTMTLLGLYGADAVLNIFGEGTFPLKDPKRFVDPIAHEVIKRNLDRLRTHESSDNMALHAQLRKAYISEYNMRKTKEIVNNNPQLTQNEEKIKKLSETLKLN